MRRCQFHWQGWHTSIISVHALPASSKSLKGIYLIVGTGEVTNGTAVTSTAGFGSLIVLTTRVLALAVEAGESAKQFVSGVVLKDNG